MTNSESLLLARQAKSKNGHARHATTLAQTLVIKDVLFKRITSKRLKAFDLSVLTHAFDRMAERERLFRMSPKPKDLDVSPEAMEKRMRRIGQARRVKPLYLEAPNPAGPPDAPDAPPSTTPPHTPPEPSTEG